MWCGKRMICGRVVLEETLPESAEIRRLAEAIGITVIVGQTPLQPNDLWVGFGPTDGWGDLAGETMWARSCEAYVVILRLTHAMIEE